eukprot:7386380-Prymnesium_polylepis.1
MAVMAVMASSLLTARWRTCHSAPRRVRALPSCAGCSTSAWRRGPWAAQRTPSLACRAVGSRREVRGWALEEGLENLVGAGQLHVWHPPTGTPLMHLLLHAALLHPAVGHDVADHRLGERPVHLGVGQQQGDVLLSYERTKHLLDAVDLLKVDGHRKDEDAMRVVDLLGTRARGEVFDVEKHLHAWADLAAALFDELANVLTERPRVCRTQEGKEGLLSLWC